MIRKNFITTSHLQLSLLLIQYMFEINNIFDNIQNTKFGKIHSNLSSPDELLTQFKDIKIELLSENTNFPVELDSRKTFELKNLKFFSG